MYFGSCKHKFGKLAGCHGGGKQKPLHRVASCGFQKAHLLRQLDALSNDLFAGRRTHSD